MRTRPAKLTAGFSLVEIAVSIGIVAVGFVAILGLLPATMDVFRSSMNLSISTQIAQRLLNDAQQTEFTALTGGGPIPLPYYELAERYFDEEGNELPDTKANESVFQAHTVVQSNPKFPDQDGDNTIVMDELASVIVQVAINPGRRALTKDSTTYFWEPEETVRIDSYNVMVAHHD